jgi:hypothetical protein
MAAFAVAIVVTGCSKPVPTAYSDTRAARPDAKALSLDISPAREAIQPAKPSAPILAYSYEFGVWIPAKSLQGLLSKHEHECSAAGFAVCQVASSSLRDDDPRTPEATLTLRATAPWVARLRSNLSSDAKAAGGRVTSQMTTSEDMTRNIVDSGAALKAQTALRDRLQKILEARPGKTSDLVQVETALAKVQQELDATSSGLEQAAGRVAFSEVSLGYKSAPEFGEAASEARLTRAIGAFGDNVVSGLAFTIDAIAVLLIPATVVGIVAWLMIGRRRRRRSTGAPLP